MTNPSVEERKKQAALALKRKLVDSLVKSSNKTEKVQKLLRESDQYKEYIAQSAASHLEAFKEAGLEETPERRKIAEKSAQHEAQKLMDNDPLGALKDEARESLKALELLTDTLVQQTEKAKDAVAAIDEVQKIEFLNTCLASGVIKVGIDKTAVQLSIRSVGSRQKELSELKSRLNKSLNSDSKTDVRKAILNYQENLESARKTVDQNSRQVASALAKMSFTIDEQALFALISQKVEKDGLESLSDARDWLDRFIGVASGLMESNSVTGTVSKALKLFSASGHAVARNAVIDEGAKDYSKGHTRNEMYSEHTDNPLMIAQHMVERQKIALDLLIKSLDTVLSGAMIATMGPGEIVMQAWAPVSIAITKIVESRLDARIELARNAIASKDSAKALEFESDETKELEKQVKDGIFEVLQEQGKSFAEGLRNAFISSPSSEEGGGTGIAFLDEITEKPGEFTATVLGWIMPPLMKRIWQIFPPKPAELITGEDLTNTQDVLFEAQIPSFARGKGPARIDTDTLTELDGRPTDIDASIWAKFESTNAGRTQSKDDPANRTYYVSTTVTDFGDAVVWGWFNPRTSGFTPSQLDPASLEDWATRTVAGTGYSEGELKTTGPEVKGRWERVKVGDFTYIALNEGGTLHWGQVGANTKGPRGVGSQLGTLVGSLSPTDRVMAGFTIVG